MFFTPSFIPNPKGSLQYLTRSTEIAAANSYNFSAQNFSLGNPHTNRRIFVGVAWRIDTGNAMRTVTGVSINPTGAAPSTPLTIHGQVGFYEAVTGGYGVALASTIIETGDVGTIQVDLSGAGTQECSVVVFRKVGLVDLTPFDTATAENESTQGSLNSTIDTADGGIMVGVCAQGSISGTPAWTAGLTEVQRFQTATNRLEVLAGINDRTAAATNATVSSSASSDSNQVGNGFVIVSWR